MKYFSLEKGFTEKKKKKVLKARVCAIFSTSTTYQLPFLQLFFAQS